MYIQSTTMLPINMIAFLHKTGGRVGGKNQSAR